MKKLTQNQIKECIDSTAIASYCNQVEYSKSELSKSLSNFGISIENLVKTEYSGVEYVSLQHSFKECAGDKLGCILILEYKVMDIEDKFAFAISTDGYDTFISSIISILYMLIEGSRAVSELNSLIHVAQSSKGASVMVTYKLGITDKFCKVCDWDYNRIKIKLSKAAITQLISLSADGLLETVVSETDWLLTIGKYIVGFNNLHIHEKINAVMNSTDIEKILTSNMLSTDDVITAITRCKSDTGTQEFKSVSIIKELGKFIAVTLWRVDYSKKSIAVRLMSDKVFDAENDRFISDRDIVDRVERKINVSDQLVNRIFGAA